MEITKGIIIIMIRVLMTEIMIIVIMKIVVIMIACGSKIPGGRPTGNNFVLWLSWGL